MKTLRTIFAFASLAAASLSAVPQNAEEMIALAREYVGGEDALTALNGLYYEARMIEYPGADQLAESPTLTEQQSEIVLYLMKPHFQRLERTSGSNVQILAVNGYAGWVYGERLDADGGEVESAVRDVDIASLRSQRAQAWQNLYFYVKPPIPGRLEDRGLTTLDGNEVYLIRYYHYRNVFFDRYFDPETGKLIATGVESGALFYDYGQREVSGIIFPESQIMMMDGEERLRIEYDVIEVNPEITESIFEEPAL